MTSMAQDEIQGRRPGDHWRVAWPVGEGRYRLAGLPDTFTDADMEMRHNRPVDKGGIKAVAR